MRNPLQALLIILALGLCSLCTWQWYGQVEQRKELTALAQTNYDQSVAIQGYTNSMNAMDKQISQMDVHISELKEIVQSNNVEITGLREDNGRLNSLVEQYKNATEVLQSQIKQANENIRFQNDAIKALVAERDEYVKRLNESIKERNEAVIQYNELVKRVEAMQAEQSKKKQK